MYNSSDFKENDKQIILDFIDENPFAFLTGNFLSGKPVATQIPILIEERNGELFLQGHLMKNTDHHKAWVENENILVVFTGPNCYVSASWYSDSGSGSTWNYMSIYISGKINFMSNQDLVLFMQKMTLKFEKENTQSPTIFDNLPADYLNKHLPAIVGFEVAVEKIDTVFKLSQNKDKKSYENIIAELEKKGGYSLLIAREMQKRK